MSWSDGLEGAHLSIASSDAPRIGVLAGPGTGKTSYGLIRRVGRLLSQGVPGDRILLISFTRVAAADLRDKVAALDAPGADSVRATTLHSYCLSLLMRDSVLALTGRKPRILMNHERDLMLRDIAGDFGSIHDRRRRLEALHAGWARRTTEHPGPALADADRVFEREVVGWLVAHDAMLIGEVVPIAHRYLSTNPAAEELSGFDHLVVDEYQDLNALEQDLLEILSTNATSLCIAGDDDQSIYSVRYANPEGIRAFLARGDVEEHSISVCGRCPANVISMANSLIEQAPGRSKVPLEPLVGDRLGEVSVVQWADVPSEIDGIVSAIADDVGRRGIEPGEILVLTNWRRIGERVRERLEDLDIAVRSFFTEEELASDEGRKAVALLRLVVDQRDLPAIRVLVGLGEASGRSSAYQRLLSYCDEHSIEVLEALSRMAGGERLSGLRVPALVERYSKAARRTEHLRSLDVALLVDQLLPPGNDALADLRGIAVDSLETSGSAHDVLNDIVAAVTQDDVPQHPNFVRVMSLHKSKGLTAGSVYILGAVDGVLPTVTSDIPAEVAAAIEEGRRLFYVALTRAARELVISTSASMDLADANARGVKYERSTIRRSGDRFTVRTIASPYIAELGPSAPRGERGEAWLASRSRDA